ncbi:ATP-binding protein [Streptomyces aureocirculatus]|uniref:ATP-binding protein n=1 Tax=Streptomyces aureocirculatus TaxID=67275 RepID=UPI001CED1B38|nr:ATP-binding protein [Streptomyces aureocirculatus]
MESAGRDDAGAPGAAVAATAVALSGDDACIATARHLAADFLSCARADKDVAVSARAMDLTQLVVSELVTNACKYAPGPLRMELCITGGTVQVTVQDSARAGPSARAVDPHRIGQHGLEIVTAVARHFQVCPLPDGKRVTAHIALTDEAADSVHRAGPPPGPR